MPMPPDSLADWLTRIESLHPKQIELGLTRVQTVAHRMGLIEFHCPVITVGGTNGKGSCVTLLAAIYQQMGYRVGSYTSPHLFEFNERICLAGQAVTDDVLVEAFAQVEKQRQATALTFFEFTTLAALYIFQQAQLDVLILEVGLGGRLDAVNLVDATVSIITNIALDHCAWLGNDRESIGFEKAGIIRASRPVLFGEAEIPATIRNHAQQLSAPLYAVGDRIKLIYPDKQSIQPESGATSAMHLQVDDKQYPLPMSPLNPESVALAVTAVITLQPQLSIDWPRLQQAVARTRLAGRQQLAGAYIFDVAHNPAAAQRLSQWLRQLPLPGRLYALFSCCADKDIHQIMQPLTDLVTHWFAAPFTAPRSATRTQLQQALATCTQTYTTADTLDSLLPIAQATLTPADRLLVFGSFYTVEQVYKTLAGQLSVEKFTHGVLDTLYLSHRCHHRCREGSQAMTMDGDPSYETKFYCGCKNITNSLKFDR
jgi:dihydrofolate synthase / folylpolyglutamate synthase